MPERGEDRGSEGRPDWHRIDEHKGIAARVILPFVSTKYKTDITIRCLLRALDNPVDDEGEGEDLQTDRLLSHEQLPPTRAWHAPPIDRTFNLRTFFSLYQAPFEQFAPLLFRHLRTHHFHISDEDYLASFHETLKPVSGLGFSGSLFFFTSDSKFIVKSVGRKFEYTFLYTRMLDAYGTYMLSPRSRPATLLCKITDVVGTFAHRFGSWLGVSPSHYMVMSNLLVGLKEGGGQKWDLKPQNFFEPTRDLIPDNIKTETARSGLADALEEGEEIVLSKKQKEKLWEALERDTEWLEGIGTVDYSLLLGRWPREGFSGKITGQWDEGVESADGKWVYRATIVDFLWGVEMLAAKFMRTAGKLLPEQTVTTEPGRYKREFMKMMEDYIDVYDDDHTRE